MYKDIIKSAGDKMTKTVGIVVKDMSTLRAGRANAQVLDRVMVDYYGVPTPINQMGNTLLSLMW